MAAKKKKLARAKKAVKRVAKRVSPIPKRYHVLTPHLNVRGADRAIAFYEAAFGARELNRMAMPGGLIGHAELRIGDSVFTLSDEMPEMGSRSPQTLGGTGGSLLIYTRDVDALFQRAVAAGATVLQPVQDMFWGDRYGRVQDPFGHEWQLATHVEDVSVKEMTRRAQAAFSGPPPTGPA